jgi:hypothetical protein
MACNCLYTTAPVQSAHSNTSCDSSHESCIMQEATAPNNQHCSARSSLNTAATCAQNPCCIAVPAAPQHPMQCYRKSSCQQLILRERQHAKKPAAEHPNTPKSCNFCAALTTCCFYRRIMPRPRPLPRMPPPLPPPIDASGASLRGFFTVSSTDRMRQAASVALWMALSFTRAGSHTNASKVLTTPPVLTSTP